MFCFKYDLGMMPEYSVNMTENLSGKQVNCFLQVRIIAVDDFINAILVESIYIDLFAADHIKVA